MSEPYFTFTKDKKTGKFDILGPIEFMKKGNHVTVTKADGSESEAILGEIGKPFIAKFGPLAGSEVAIGKIATKQESQQGDRPRPTKKCWECGQEFSFHDAQVNDGDWNDSYCGC